MTDTFLTGVALWLAFISLTGLVFIPLYGLYLLGLKLTRRTK